ncbi:MAG: VOC family protein [Actinomycetota bacterium]|nr:VOC family protein [Actinomycetota bacterium]MDQ6947155.1 VOC family protein [Actinomycetota bacterium]
MKIKELGHLVLYVRDVKQSSAFYRDVLGWQQISPEGLAVAAFSSGRTHHELLLIEVGPDAAPLPRGRHVGLYHFGLKIGDTDEELRTARAALLEAGVRIAGAADHTVSHSLYIYDPDGNEIELYVDVADVDWRTHPESVLAPTRPLVL